MQSQIQELDLDLTFSAAPASLWGTSLDAATKKRLTNAGPWEKDLENWIQALRKNCSLSCPKIVRKATSISLGLRLTDDETI